MTKRNTKAEKGKYALLFGFWGDWYTRVFLRYSLGSLLFPANLPRLARQHDVAVKIATTEAGRKHLESDPLFQRARRDFNVELRVFPEPGALRGVDGWEKYDIWTAMMNSLIKISAEEGRDLFFLHPDSFYPDGYFGKIVAQARKGKRLIFSAGVRVDAAKMDAMFPERGRPISRVSKQAFEALTIANLHEFVRRQYWDSETLSYWPSGLLCRLDRNVTVARFFDMHPIYVALSEGRGPIKKNVDTDYDSDIMARMLERGAGDTIEVLKGENSYFASLTATDEPWATRLTLVGDDPNAPLDSLTFPRSDTEKFLHVAKWAAKYVPLKKILCFQPLYVFRTESGRHQFPAQRALEFSALCDSLVAYFPLLQTEVRPRFSLELPHLNVQIDA